MKLSYEAVTAITDIGDSSVITALVVFCAAYLVSCGCRRGAGVLAGALMLAITLIALFKLLFLGCDPLHNPFHIHSPSGHAALSAAVYGAFALLAASQLKGWWRFLPALFAIMLILMIALSRVWLGAHSVDEIILGLLTGSAALGLVYIMLVRGKRIPPFSMGLLITASLLAVVIFHGIRLPAEVLIHAIAQRFHAYDPLCGKQ